MGGLNNAQTTDLDFTCYCSQVTEMVYDPAYTLAPFMKAIYSNSHPNAAKGTDWTMMGSLSNSDALDWDYQATTLSNSGGLNNNHRIGYSYVPSCPGQPGWSTGYGHGDYMNDQCEGYDASYYYCDGCSETQHSNFSFANKNAPHSLHDMLFAFTYYNW